MIVWLVAIGGYLIAITCLLAIVGSRRRKLERCMRAGQRAAARPAVEELGDAPMRESLVGVPASGSRQA